MSYLMHHFQGVKRLFVLAYFIAAGANADEKIGIKVFSLNRLKIIRYWLMEEVFMTNQLMT